MQAEAQILLDRLAGLFDGLVADSARIRGDAWSAYQRLADVLRIAPETDGVAGQMQIYRDGWGRVPGGMFGADENTRPRYTGPRQMIETCGMVADWDAVNGHLTLHMTSQAPHAIRTGFALVAGHVRLAEHKIRIISPDIGGGFGGKVPVYPGYVIAVAASSAM